MSSTSVPEKNKKRSVSALSTKQVDKAAAGGNKWAKALQGRQGA